MEVHHHAHPASSGTGTPRKAWKHYFWEFFMLFMAVFCGYQSERLFEHNRERERERKYMHTLISDLKADTSMISQVRKKRIARQDQLLRLILHIGSTDMQRRAKEIYALSDSTDNYESFIRNDRTIQQLKTTGNMRLVDDDVAAAIMDYDNFITSEIDWNNRTEASRIDHYKQLRSILFNAQILNMVAMLKDPYKMKYVSDTGRVYALMPAEKGRLNEMTGALFQVMRISETCADSGDTAIAKAARLIELIKKDYNIKD
jgi:hypothetical protein